MEEKRESVSTLCVTAENAYITDIIKLHGHEVMHPYTYRTFAGRLFLEVWFRLHLPQWVLFNKAIKGVKADKIIVKDPLITRPFLDWLIKHHPHTEIIFEYGNMVGKARHLYPKDIPESIAIWTYDAYDSETYGLHLSAKGSYSRVFVKPKKAVKYDVFYVGADKGRGEYLLDLQSKMEAMGLKTKFIITPNGRLSRRKKYYQKPIPYSQVTEHLAETKAVLNIGMPNQKGATMRDFESIFNGIKLITNTENIKTFDFYRPENVFILGERDLSELPAFLASPVVPIEDELLDSYTAGNG